MRRSTRVDHPVRGGQWRGEGDSTEGVGETGDPTVTKQEASEVVLASRQDETPGWAPGGMSQEPKSSRLEARQPPKRAAAAAAMEAGRCGEVDREGHRE